MTHTNTPTAHTQGVTHSLALPHKTPDEVVGSLCAPPGFAQPAHPPEASFCAPHPSSFSPGCITSFFKRLLLLVPSYGGELRCVGVSCG